MGDTKDWTWVLQRRCPDCGFEAVGLAREEIGATARDVADRFVEILASGPDVVRRPEPDVWSAAEYGCHVRDVFRIYRERVQRMLEEDDPAFANWDQDATAVEDRYGEQDPSRVAAELREAGRALADTFDGVTDEQWRRPGRRSDGALFTIESIGKYFVHDPLHHVWDAEVGFDRLRHS